MDFLKRIEGEGADSLGARIRQARRAQNLTLEALAAKVGVSKVSVWSWEMDRSRPRRSYVSPLSDALGVSPERLLIDGMPSGPEDVAALIADCRRRIGLAVGTSPEHVGIVISFGTGEQSVGSAAPALE